MKPDWQTADGKYQLFLGDCVEVLPHLAESSIDSVVTDPPYCSGGVSEASRTAAKGQGLRSENIKRFGWFVGDNMTTAGLVWLLRCVTNDIRTLMRGTGSVVIFCDWRMLPTLVPAIESCGLRYQNLVVWNKGHFGMGNGFRCQHEMAMHFTCGSPEYHSASVGNVITAGRVGAEEREHQTQKPVELLLPIVEVVCPQGGTVLDPFMGSASTGVACIQSGRGFIGIEKESANFTTAVARMEAELSRVPLFDTPPQIQRSFLEESA